MIEVEGISKRHGGEWVLRDISLTVPEESYLGLIGPGGAGKSLLMKILVGLVDPDRGTVRVRGTNVQSLSETERDELRIDIGMLFQNYALFDFMTVAENIAFPLRREGELDGTAIEARVEELLREIGLPHAADQYPKELSGGMKKRVSFARAIVRQPPMLMYDDPTAGLDPVTSAKIFRLLRKLKREQPTTAVTISHDIGGIRELSDRVVMLDDGEMVFEGTVDEIGNCERPRVREFWRGHEVDALHGRDGSTESTRP